MYIYAHIYIHIHIHIRIHVYIFFDRHRSAYAHIYTSIHIYTCTHIHTHVYLFFDRHRSAINEHLESDWLIIHVGVVYFLFLALFAPFQRQLVRFDWRHLHYINFEFAILLRLSIWNEEEYAMSVPHTHKTTWRICIYVYIYTCVHFFLFFSL